MLIIKTIVAIACIIGSVSMQSGDAVTQDQLDMPFLRAIPSISSATKQDFALQGLGYGQIPKAVQAILEIVTKLVLLTQQLGYPLKVDGRDALDLKIRELTNAILMNPQFDNPENVAPLRAAMIQLEAATDAYLVAIIVCNDKIPVKSDAYRKTKSEYDQFLNDAIKKLSPEPQF